MDSPKDEFAVLVQADLFDAEAGELLLDAGGAIRVVFRIRLGPPVFEIALEVKLAPLIVEAVGHLVANNGPDRSIVKCIVGAQIEIGRLQNARRKNYLVHQRVVVGVDGRRRHGPLGAVDRPSHLREVPFPLKLTGTQQVVDE